MPRYDLAGAANNIIPATGGAAVTKSDTTRLVGVRALYVGGTGDIAVVFAADDTNTAVTFVGVPAGTILPVAVQKVMSTNTNATSIVALY
jgi:hypothetical protein